MEKGTVDNRFLKNWADIRFIKKIIQAGFFYNFLPIFQHKWMFFSKMQTLPFEGHNMAYQSKGLDQSTIVCEYEVNRSTNEKVITEKTKL